jgi:glycosyltransferase involved in cell wall biosynthesis
MASQPEDLPIARLGALLNRARLVYIPFDYFPGVIDASPQVLSRWRMLEEKYSRAVDAWVSGGDMISQKYLQEYPDLANRVHTVYSGLPKHVPYNSRVLRKRIGLDSTAIVVLYQGLISKARGLWDVVDAMPHLPANVHFAVVGGYENTQLRAYAVSKNVADRVHVLDFVPQRELPGYTADADIGIIPIQPACESYAYCNPSKLFEFLAMGLPLAVSSLDQLRWYVTKHGLGEVFAPGSVEGIVRAIEKLALNPGYRRQCSINSQKVHATEACWEIQAERLRRAVLGASKC